MGKKQDKNFWLYTVLLFIVVSVLAFSLASSDSRAVGGPLKIGFPLGFYQELPWTGETEFNPISMILDLAAYSIISAAIVFAYHRFRN